MNTASVAGLVAGPFMGAVQREQARGGRALGDAAPRARDDGAAGEGVGAVPGMGAAPGSPTAPATGPDADAEPNAAIAGMRVGAAAVASTTACRPPTSRPRCSTRSAPSSSGSSRTTSAEHFWADVRERAARSRSSTARIPTFALAALSRVAARDRRRPDPADDRVAARRVRLLDQRALPGAAAVRRLRDGRRARRRDRNARGARRARARRGRRVRRRARRAHAAHDAAGARRGARSVARARPTAVNLAWGVDARARRVRDAAARDGALAAAEALAARRRRAQPAHRRARRARSFRVGARVLTHCNTGSLACVGYGTALGVDPRRGPSAGARPRVWVDETRPLLQGARLTMWELDRLGIDATLIADGAAASLMAAGEVDLVIVGADRIAANGDVANKIGTYGLAVLGAPPRIPFYVAAPDVDDRPRDTPTAPRSRSRSAIPTRCARSAAARSRRRARAVRNPAFDVTPGPPRHRDRHRGRHRPPPVRAARCPRTSAARRAMRRRCRHPRS